MAKEQYSGIWVFAEQENGILSSTTFELLAKSYDLKAKLGGTDTVTALLSHYGAVVDFKKVIPLVIEEIKSRKA